MEPHRQLMLCLNCEDHIRDFKGTVDRAIRITIEGRCKTCGSSSVMHIQRPEFKWERKARVRRSLRIA